MVKLQWTHVKSVKKFLNKYTEQFVNTYAKKADEK
jgi:hypothetical protein